VAQDWELPGLPSLQVAAIMSYQGTQQAALPEAMMLK
jgi:hypothetical protein